MGPWLVLALLSLLMSASIARASDRSEVQPANTEAFIYLGASRGYELGISMPNPRIAVLYVFRFPDWESSQVFTQSAYAVRVSGDLLERGVVRARFPSLGKVSLRFKPSGKRRVRPVRKQCRGRPNVLEFGTFRGLVSLEGEDGYFRVAARSVGGSLRRTARLVCRDGEAAQDQAGAPLSDYVTPGFGFFYSSGSGTIALLRAQADTGSRLIGIRAAHREGDPPGAEVQVGALEWRSRMAIGRSVIVDEGPPGTFTTSMPGIHPAFATLAPPAPFYGEGNYLENSSTSHSWTGTLGVSLPGLNLPLAGADFKTSLCVVSPLVTPAGCDFIEPKPLRGARINIPQSWRHR